MKIKLEVCSVVVALLGASACGPRPEDPAPDAGVLDDLPPEIRMAVDASLDHIDAHAALLGLSGRGQVKLAHAFVDELDLTHARFQQTTGGVPVFGGEGIVHLERDRSISSVTDAFVPRIAVDTTPKLTPGEAIARAMPKGGSVAALATPPATDLWALRHEGRDHLVWRVQLRLDEGTNDISMPVVFVDAHDGSIVWQYDNLQTGSGPSLYSGTVTFDTTLNAGLYYMEDIPRKLGTFDMRNGTSTLFRFDDADDVWDATAQRAGIDAHLGALKTYEYFKNVHNRNGINGNGGPGSQLAIDGVTQLITSRVHYSSNYNNAFWDGTRMTYGDGNGVQFSSLVTLDVAGHEMMHGITQFTAGLVYSGESGALNESYSDVFGAMVERYARGESPAIWMIGDECYTPATPGDALRHMDSPHLASNKGYTSDDDPDHYNERYTGSSDNGGVHINSGISNKTFYLLAQGGTHHLGGSMTGIGADKAAAIWYKALTTYMTTSTNFVRAGKATYDAAVVLYGAESLEAAAVVSAWGMTGIVIDLAAPVTAITAPADGGTVAAPMTITASATDNVGVTSVQFLINGTVVGTDTTSPYTYSWNTLATGNGTYTIASKAFDAAGNSAQSATITVTVAHETVPPAVAITAPAEGATVANTVTVTATASDNTAVARVELHVNGALHSTDTTAPYSFSWNTLALPNGPQTISARAFDTVGNSAMSAIVNVTTDNDKTPPNVAITAPAGGAVVENTVTITADATDNVGVTRVDFYVGAALLGSDTTAPYSFAWNTQTYADGSYVLSARARDALNNIGTSANVTVTVDNDSIPPVVALTAPADGAVVANTVTLAADATDNVAVTRVDFYVGTTLVGSDTTAPYSVAWNTHSYADNTYVLTARARDALNNIGISAAVTVTVDNDSIPPAVAITAPADGSTVSGTLPVAIDATDNVGVTKVELYVDGIYGGADYAAPFEISWNTVTHGNGSHALTARAFDALNNSATSSAVTVTAATPGLATYDATLKAPRCATEGNQCDTGGMVVGRATLGPEAHAPNTIGGTCLDNTSGTFHVNPSLDRLRVFTSDGLPIAAGKAITIEAVVWSASSTADRLDLYHTATPSAPVWTLIGSLLPGGTGTRTITTTFTLPSGTQHAIRGQYRNGGASSSPCYSGSYNDRDDLVFAAVDVPDTTPPVAAITAPAAGTQIVGTATVTATATDNVGVNAVELHVDGTLVATDTAAPYSFTWNSTTVPDGAHALTVRAIDPSGNAGDSAPVAITVFNADIVAPVASITSPTAGSVVSGVRTVSVTATDAVGVTAVELYVDGTLIGTDTLSPFSFSWSTTTVPNGSHTLLARARDAANNVGISTPVAVTVSNADTTPPAVSITSPAAGSTVSEVTTVNATATDFNGVTSVDFYRGGVLIGTDTTAPYSIAWDTTTIPNGSHTLQARARDASNNLGTSAPIGVIVANIDTTAPVAMITSPLPGSSVSSSITVGATATDFNGVTAVELYVDGTLAATDTTSPFNFSWNTTLVPNGLHTLQVRARDAAANVGVSAPVGVTVANPDGTAPFTSITSPEPGAVVSGTVTVVSDSTDFNGVTSAELLVDGVVIATRTSAPWEFTWDTTTAANKARLLQTRAYDAAGNVGSSLLVAVVVDNGIGTAAYDPVLQAPRCAIGLDGCDTGALVAGRGGVGPEPNAPNTINDSCADGNSGVYGSSSSIDRLRVFTVDGQPLAPGKAVVVEATVWNYHNHPAYDVIDFYYTWSPSSPSWIYIGSVTPGAPQGPRVVTTSFVLPGGSDVAVRANMRRKQGANKESTCTQGVYNDHDDIVFAVGGP